MTRPSRFNNFHASLRAILPEAFEHFHSVKKTQVGINR